MADSSAELVRNIRKKTGWTQERLAREVGVSFSTVNGWERGRRKPMPFLMKRLRELADTLPSGTTEQDNR
jgi:putative transcriptional regulator